MTDLMRSIEKMHKKGYSEGVITKYLETIKSQSNSSQWSQVESVKQIGLYCFAIILVIAGAIAGYNSWADYCETLKVREYTEKGYVQSRSLWNVDDDSEPDEMDVIISTTGGLWVTPEVAKKNQEVIHETVQGVWGRHPVGGIAGKVHVSEVRSSN